MSIAPQLRQFLDEAKADYEVIDHRPTLSALDSARSANIRPECIAKAVLLDTADDHLLAVVPADRKVELSELRSELGSKPRLATESDVGKLFRDCEVGAVPPVGYGVTTIVDDSIDRQSDVYFEAGDHKSLIHMTRGEFTRLTRDARHGQFSEPWLSE